MKGALWQLHLKSILWKWNVVDQIPYHESYGISEQEFLKCVKSYNCMKNAEDKAFQLMDFLSKNFGTGSEEQISICNENLQNNPLDDIFSLLRFAEIFSDTERAMNASQFAKKRLEMIQNNWKKYSFMNAGMKRLEV